MWIRRRLRRLSLKRSRSRGYEELTEELKQGTIRPGYFLIGEEFQREEALNVLLDAIVDPQTRAFNLDVFTAGEADVGAIINAALSPPMLAERRTVVVKNCERLSNAHWKQCAPLLTHPPTSTCLIVSGEKVDGRNKIVAGAQRFSSIMFPFSV